MAAARCASTQHVPAARFWLSDSRARSAVRGALQRTKPLARASPRCGAAAQPAAPSSAADASSPSLPASFRRLVAPRTGVSLREVASVVSVPTPTPGPGEVLLRVKYAGVNGGCETFRARGEHWFAANANKGRGVTAKRPPLVIFALTRRADCFPLGAEGAGEVVAAGEGVQLPLGAAVTFVGVRSGEQPGCGEQATRSSRSLALTALAADALFTGRVF